MLTEKDYCDYDTCVALIEQGFVGASPIIYKYKEKAIEKAPRNLWLTPRVAKAHGWILGIHLYSAQKWLREEKHIEVLVLSKGMVGAPYDVQVYTEDYSISDDKEYSSYEDALSEGLRKAVEILKGE